jgi:hypothetical protein
VAKTKEELIAHRGTEFTEKKSFFDCFLKLQWLSPFSLFYFVPSWLGGKDAEKNLLHTEAQSSLRRQVKIVFFVANNILSATC